MERKRNIVRVAFFSASILLGLVVFSASARASSGIESYRCQIYNAYISGNMNEWLLLLRQMEQSYAKQKSDELQLEIVRSYYGYIPFIISKGNKKDADRLLDKAFEYLNSYLKKYPRNAEVLAIKSSFFGFRIAINPLKGPFLGPKSQDILKEAEDIAPKNPWVLLDKANALHYTPKLFGGDPQEALKIYNESIAILVKQGNNSCIWNYLNAYINLAYCQIKLKQYSAAMDTYNKLLSIAPSFKWVKQELIPELRKKMQKNS